MKMMSNILAVLFFCTLFTFAQKKIPAEIKFIVVDDKGERVHDVLVGGAFPHLWNGAEGDQFKGITDENGCYIGRGKSMNGLYVDFEKEGYYPTVLRKTNEKYPDIDKWEEEIEILLKKIRNPIPMYVRKFYNPHTSAFEKQGKGMKYNLGKTSEYDFVKADFLPPYGKGERRDMRAVWKMVIYKKDQYGVADDYDTYCEISFTNGLDGICRGKPDGGGGSMDNGSKFISRYEAPLEGYTNSVVFWSKVRGSEYRRETNDDNHKLYYFRIRTQVDENGRITNAIYGKIYGELNGVFTYYLNPTPNNRNMEYDGKTNLFPDQKKEKYLP